ncbi:MAD2L1-binding protein isoform 1-T1 [Fundulus diaphanus]
MAQHSDVLQPITNSDERESPCVQRGDPGSAGRPSISSGRDIRIADEPSMGCSLLRLWGDFDDSRLRAPSAEVHEDVRAGSVGRRSESKNAAVVKGVPVEEHRVRNTGDKENSSEVVQDEAEEKMSGPDYCVTAGRNNTSPEEQDAEVVRKAREEGRVDVVFPGAVTQDGCYRFVSEILKCVLYQRQQLPMTYEQLVYSQRQQQAAAQVGVALARGRFSSKGGLLISKMLNIVWETVCSPGKRRDDSEAVAICRYGPAQTSADPSGAGGGAAAAGGAVLFEQSAPRVTVDGRLRGSPQRAVRDQHGGPGPGRRRAASSDVLLLEAALPHPFRRRPVVRHQARSPDAHHRPGSGSQGVRRGLVPTQTAVQSPGSSETPNDCSVYGSQRL